MALYYQPAMSMVVQIDSITKFFFRAVGTPHYTPQVTSRLFIVIQCLPVDKGCAPGSCGPKRGRDTGS